jgi:hypothetical protein
MQHFFHSIGIQQRFIMLRPASGICQEIHLHLSVWNTQKDSHATKKIPINTLSEF